MLPILRSIGGIRRYGGARRQHRPEQQQQHCEPAEATCSQREAHHFFLSDKSHRSQYVLAADESKVPALWQLLGPSE
jgi:hypothetical protein